MAKKGDLTYSKIVDSAVKSFSEYGDKGTTFQSIADLAGVSQPLVSKYFKTRDAVLPAAIEKFLSYAISTTELALSKTKNPKEEISEYLRISIDMFRTKPEMFRIYLLLHNYAGFELSYLKTNSEIKLVAVERVQKIILRGIEQGIFKKCNSKIYAKIIHSSLVGVILSISTENQVFTDRQLQKVLEEMVFALLLR